MQKKKCVCVGGGGGEEGERGMEGPYFFFFLSKEVHMHVSISGEIRLGYERNANNILGQAKLLQKMYFSVQP